MVEDNRCSLTIRICKECKSPGFCSNCCTTLHYMNLPCIFPGEGNPSRDNLFELMASASRLVLQRQARTRLPQITVYNADNIHVIKFIWSILIIHGLKPWILFYLCQFQCSNSIIVWQRFCELSPDLEFSTVLVPLCACDTVCVFLDWNRISAKILYTYLIWFFGKKKGGSLDSRFSSPTLNLNCKVIHTFHNCFTALRTRKFLIMTFKFVFVKVVFHDGCKCL